MKKLWIITAILAFSISTIMISCKTSCHSKCCSSTSQSADKTMKDSAKYVILSNESYASIYFKDSKMADLNSDEINRVLQLVTEAVQMYNNHENTRAVSPDALQLIDLDKYYMQLVPVIFQKEKVVLVNCFCDPMGTNWKTDLVMVKDGGKCYFTVKINLTKKSYYDFFVNGMG
jgi:hypothetical protein